MRTKSAVDELFVDNSIVLVTKVEYHKTIEYRSLTVKDDIFPVCILMENDQEIQAIVVDNAIPIQVGTQFEYRTLNDFDILWDATHGNCTSAISGVDINAIKHNMFFCSTYIDNICNNNTGLDFTDVSESDTLYGIKEEKSKIKLSQGVVSNLFSDNVEKLMKGIVSILPIKNQVTNERDIIEPMFYCSYEAYIHKLSPRFCKRRINCQSIIEVVELNLDRIREDARLSHCNSNIIDIDVDCEDVSITLYTLCYAFVRVKK